MKPDIVHDGPHFVEQVVDIQWYLWIVQSALRPLLDKQGEVIGRGKPLAALAVRRKGFVKEALDLKAAAADGGQQGQSPGALTGQFRHTSAEVASAPDLDEVVRLRLDEVNVTGVLRTARSQPKIGKT